MQNRYGSPFREVTLTGAELWELTGRGELPLTVRVEMSRGYGDWDDSIRFVTVAGGFAGVPTIEDCEAMREPFRTDAFNALYAEALESDE